MSVSARVGSQSSVATPSGPEVTKTDWLALVFARSSFPGIWITTG